MAMYYWSHSYSQSICQISLTSKREYMAIWMQMTRLIFINKEEEERMCQNYFALQKFKHIMHFIMCHLITSIPFLPFIPSNNQFIWKTKVFSRHRLHRQYSLYIQIWLKLSKYSDSFFTKLYNINFPLFLYLKHN